MAISSNRKIKLGASRSQGTLGTFAGVFTPSILTILGIILFLRLGYVVGNAGLAKALVIICLANMISVLTSLSLAAIATNLKVKLGGHYYLISRTLGIEFGGAIGIVLFLAMSVSIAFYCIGLGEVLATLMLNPWEGFPQVIAAVALVFLTIFAWLGADWATRLQYVVMGIVATSLLSFYFGAITHFDIINLSDNWASPGEAPSLWVLFAIFFPAVTGFTQGISMSGDLKDPRKSLTQGTFAAVGISIFVYLTAAIVLAAAAPNETLSNNYYVMNYVAQIGWLISAGVIAGTLSSAMASLLGAPRILQSLAQDRIFSPLVPFGKGVGKGRNPRRGVLLSAAIAMATIGLGKLNIIAPVVSMFFLISYGLLNYATFYEARAASPAFRPTFRWFNYRLSLVGALGCLGVMLAIDLFSSAIAVAVLFGIHQYLQRTASPARWADSKISYHFQLMREHLLAIPGEQSHPRDWRPQLLVFSDDPPRRKSLLQFASWIEGDSGLITAVKILVGQGKKVYQQKLEAEAQFRKELAELELNAFVKIITAPEFTTGADVLFQSFGIGPIRANTILLNGPEQLTDERDPKGQRRYRQSLSEAFRLGSNIVIFNAEEEKWNQVKDLPVHDRNINVWWWEGATSRLMLLFAYLMTRKNDWAEARIRVLAPTARKGAKKNLNSLIRSLEDVRINAEPEVIVEPTLDTIVEHSYDAAVTFLPLYVKGTRLLSPLGVSFEEILSRLSMGALVIAAEDIDLEAEPEEGRQGQIAAALDASADADRIASEAEKEAEKTGKLAEQKRREVKEATKARSDKDKLTELKAAFEEANKAAKKAYKDAEKARALAEDAAKFADELINQPENANPLETPGKVPTKKVKRQKKKTKGK